MLTLAHGFLRRGHPVDVVVVRAQGELLPRVPPRARLVELATKRVAFSVPALARYLRRERPMALLSTLPTANLVAVLAARMVRPSTRVAIRLASLLSRDLERGMGPSSSLLRWVVRWSYPHADAVVAVSTAVADDLAGCLRLERCRIHVIPNPIVTNDLVDLAHRSLDHEWFASGASPVILGVGRLGVEKRFDLLIEAFARVRERCESRLMILGEGAERHRLQALIRERHLEACVSLPGFVENPFAYLSRARVFVLSSDWEGSPGVLIQALACGTPVVATDCDSAREILQEGRLGRLVPVGDASALADAISAVLGEPAVSPPADACLAYSESSGVDAYLRMLRGLHAD
jgi:glycosyltransferase involved in cell wall biosynthesis